MFLKIPDFVQVCQENHVPPVKTNYYDCIWVRSKDMKTSGFEGDNTKLLLIQKGTNLRTKWGKI